MRGEGDRMGTQKGRVDVQQQPPSSFPSTPRPPANSAAARRSARSTGSNATTAYNTSPSRSPAVYLAAATLLRTPPALSLFLAVASLSLLLIITRRRLAHPSTTVIYMRTHSGVAARLPFLPRAFFALVLVLARSPSVVAADSARGNTRSGARVSQQRARKRRGTTMEECDVATPDVDAGPQRPDTRHSGGCELYARIFLTRLERHR